MTVARCSCAFEAIGEVCRKAGISEATLSATRRKPLRSHRLPKRSLELVDEMDASIGALDGLFGSLLDISRLDAGAVYQAGQFPSIEILFQINGRVSAGGEKYGPETGYEFVANEGPVPVEAVEPTEFLRTVLHTF